jgi:hypothetical protein
MASVPTAPLSIISSPDGAHLIVDGFEGGITPTALNLPLGPHDLTLEAAGAVAERRHLSLDATGATLDVRLWHDRPTVEVLQPALPGAAISDTDLLTDGRLGLVVTLPGDERQAWTIDPLNHLAVDRLGLVAPRAPMTIRPDGRGVAFLQPSSQPAPSSLTAADSLPGPHRRPECSLHRL